MLTDDGGAVRMFGACKDWVVATPGIAGAPKTAARAALIDTVFKTNASIAAGGISCLMIGLATAWRCSSTIPLVWTLAYISLVCARLGLNNAYAAQGHAQMIKDRWAQLYAAGALLSAAMLGLAAGIAIALDLPTALLAALAAIGSAGGFAGRNSALPRLATAQCTLLVLPTALAGFWSAEPVNMMLAPTAVGYGFALQTFVRQHYAEASALIIAHLADAELARHDHLTGIPNRRCFDERLMALWPPGEPAKRPLSLLLIDIDYFRRYNDLYGRPAGDDCLRRIARALRDLLGEGELIARYGGEQFAVLLPGCSLDEALLVANRFCRAVTALYIEQAMRTDDLEIVTASIGIGASNAVASADQLIEMADRSLYRAKLNGRNRVFPESVETLVALQRSRTTRTRSA
jgi:diguanylate cyclase (GGDEF)-like protein